MKQTAPDNHKLLLGALAVSVFLTVTAIAALGPLLIEMSRAFGTSVPLMAQLVTTASATWAVTALVAGPFSDAYGRRPVLVLGLSLLALGALGLALTPSFGLAALSCICIGMGGGMVPPTCVSLVGDTVPESDKAMSIALLTMQPGLSSVVGVPLSVALADVAGWRMPFAVLAVALFAAAVLVFVRVPYQRSDRAALNLGVRLYRVASFRVTWSMALTNVLSRMTWGVLLTFFPAFLIVTYGLETIEVALPLAGVALWATAAPLLGGRIARTRRRLPVTAVMLLSASLPGVCLFILDLGIWPAVIVAGVFVLLTVPVTTLLLILTAETGGTSRGTLSGVISSSNWGGTAAGAALGGLLVAQFGFGALSYLLCGAIVLSATLMALGVNDRTVARARAHFAVAVNAPPGKEEQKPGPAE